MTNPCTSLDQCHHWPRHDDRFDCGFLDGRTVTAEQVEKAAWEYLHYTFTPNPSGVSEFHWSRARRIAATTLTAAGFTVEGGE